MPQREKPPGADKSYDGPENTKLVNLAHKGGEEKNVLIATNLTPEEEIEIVAT